MTSFDYVLGTLSEIERAEFELALTDNIDLQKEVHFWEEHLMALHRDTRDLPADPNTWKNIAKKIGIDDQTDSLAIPDSAVVPINQNRTNKRRSWVGSKPLQWIIPLAASILFALGFGLSPLLTKSGPNADYVAVLTAPDGTAKLTALTATHGQVMWLQWQDVATETNASIQLWAVSKRDGQIRSIAVFNSASIQSLALDQAAMRLVKDAEKLILTKEELGGSATDEPSENVIASGICVRLTMTKEKSG